MTKHQLRVRTSVAAVTLGAAAIGLGISLADATPSTAISHAATHTQRFVSRDVKSYQLGKNGNYVDFSKDVSQGIVLGADSTSGKYHPKTAVVTGKVSILRKGGLMTGTFTLDTRTGDLSGTIVGGWGQYKGATGTISAHAVNDKVTKVKLTYRL